MDNGLAYGIYSNKLEGNATGLYDNIRTGLHNGIYNENLLPNNIVKRGLVFYLDAAYPKSYSKTGIYFNDLSNNNNNIILNNNPIYTNQYNGGLIFNGTNNYGITNQNQTPLLNISDQFTLDCWITSTATASASQGDGLITKGLSSDNNTAIFELLLVPSGGINYPFIRIYTTSSNTYFPTNIAIQLNQIYNIVATYNGNILRIFVNNIESGNGISVSGKLQTNTNQLTIGVRYLHIINPGNDSFFSGNIYQSKIYNIALSQSEITQNYIATKSRFNL